MYKEFWRFLKREKATSISGVPYTYDILNKLRFTRMELPHLKTLTQAGGKINETLQKQFAEFCKKNKMGIQEGARKLRYDWFDDLLSKFNFDYLVTAHHLDDQIETYLINSSRGSGINGLLGITSSSQKIFRPLLNILKIDILDYAQQNSLDYREDSSNSSEDYQRNMIRNSVLPTFNEFDDNVMLKFKTTINNLQSTKIFVDEIMKETKNQLFVNNTDSIKVNIEMLMEKKPLEFYVHNLFHEFGFNYKEVIKIFNSDSGKHILSNTHNMTKLKGDLIIKKND